MKITELLLNQKIILQILWGERKIEFNTEVVELQPDGVCVNPVIHDDKPLEFDITNSSKVMCHVFADDIVDKKRISWKNVELKTLKKDGRTTYFLKTSGFNSIAGVDDRRKEDRMLVHKGALLVDEATSAHIDVMIHDISDIGISFYAPGNYTPASQHFTILFSDCVGDQTFSMKIECVAARSKQAVGTSFYGCKIVGQNKEYLMYGFMKRLEKKKKEKGLDGTRFIEEN